MTVKELIKQLRCFEGLERCTDVLIYNGDCGEERPINRISWEYNFNTGKQHIIIIPD